MAYTVEQKAAAIAIVNRHDGQVSAEALGYIQAIRGLKNVTRKTVLRWLKEGGSPQNVTENVSENVTNVTEKKRPVTQADIDAADVALDDLFERVARKYLAHALNSEVVKEAKGKEAVIAAATATDKMRLLRDLPTEIVGIIPGFVEDARRKGYDPIQLLVDLREAINASPDAPLH